MNEKLQQFGKGLLNKAKNTKIVQQATKAVKFIMKNLPLIKIISLVVGIIILVINFIFLLVGLYQNIGATPHYYCNPQADSYVKNTTIYRQYCNNYTGLSGGNEGIAEAAITLATHDLSLGHSQINYTQGGMIDLEKYRGKYPVENFIAIVPKIVDTAKTLHNAGKRQGHALWWDDYYASCDLAVSTAVLWSGADDVFPMYLRGRERLEGIVYGQTGYFINDKTNKKWVEVPKGEKILPGDIALGNIDNAGGYGHIWMYVATWENGKWTNNDLVQKRFPGSTSNRYEGSSHQYYSRLSRDGNPWDVSSQIFRYVGTIDETSPFKSIGG